MQPFIFPTPSEQHMVYVKDKQRCSGLTSIRFLSKNRLVCCDFNEKMMYLCEYKEDEIKILSSIPTITEDGTPVQTDLLDVNDEGLLVVSNFYQGSQSFYRYEEDRLSFLYELKLSPYGRCHGVRFYPGHPDILWVLYCETQNRCIVIIDFRKKKVLHVLRMPEQMQDVAFIGKYALAAARTDHIARGRPYKGIMYATIYLFRLPDNLYNEKPKLIDTWTGEGHLDAIVEHGDRVYSANQYTETIDCFSVSENEKIIKKSSIIGYKNSPDTSIIGFAMPHGMDVREDGYIAVTNYLDNSLRMFFLNQSQEKTASPSPSLTYKFSVYFHKLKKRINNFYLKSIDKKTSEN